VAALAEQGARLEQRRLAAVEDRIQADLDAGHHGGRSLLPSTTRVSSFRSPSDPRAACPDSAPGLEIVPVGITRT
jgi:hypothetical protein